MMKLAYRVFVVSLFCLSLAVVSFAQSPTPRVSGQTTVTIDKSKRSAKDDRNTAPTVGTGGAMGGPTGLFTVYDAQTLRRGEYTFSAAYSNFDRDPGDVDITEVPVSFQIGVTNNFELFFNTDAYRGVKVNSPGNLSSFYLPNSRINGISPGALILAPGAGGGLVFRPAGTQPFVQYPYFGGSTGNFGFPNNFPTGPYFGLGNVIPTIGGVVTGGDGADAFPGLGSIYGSILPGIVFRTACSQGTGAACTGGLIAPTSFEARPSYLPDAPFINRTWGESAFSTYTVGGKIRFNDVNDWWGLALVPAYRFYQDNADSFGGFNQLQRGASPGGKWSRGDILMTLAMDGRLASWMHMSGNVGYHWNSSVKSDLFGQDVTLLDRPDELLGSVGVDFPVNRYFQPIGEFRKTWYVGGRTPNAFENNPYEGLIGFRVFPARWFGFSAAYRHHFNQQDDGPFSDDDEVIQTAFVPCLGFGSTVPNGEQFCQSEFIAVTSSFRGTPPGFRTSSDPHGFMFQAFIGRRNPRQEEQVNKPANVTALAVSDSNVKLGCEPGFKPREGQVCAESTSVSVTTTALDPEGDLLVYNYTVSGGRIVGEGANVTWDLSGVPAGTYTITAGVDDGCGLCGQTQTQTVVVEACDCERIIVCECPTITVSGPAGITDPGTPVTFTANVAGGTQTSVTYNWTVSAGTITSGQGTPSITVDTAGLSNTTVTATLNIGGTDTACNCTTTYEAVAPIAAEPEARLVDEFGAMPNDDIRGRLDLFFNELSNNPSNQGYIINYGTPAQIAARERLITNHINFRGVDRSRITLVNGGTSPDGVPTTKLYLVPPGADNPTP
jgi:hypothetical protein